MTINCDANAQILGEGLYLGNNLNLVNIVN
jgi:hypothetical protein